MSELLYTQEQLIEMRNRNYVAGVQDAQENLIARLKEDICEQPKPGCCDGYCAAYLEVIKIINGEIV